MFTGFVIGDRGLGASGDTHPAWMMAHAEVGPYLIIGASAAGQLHLARKKPRDDAFVIRSVGPWLTVAVADGVGSRPLSRYGATYVVESLTALLMRKLAPPARIAYTPTTNYQVPMGEDAELKNLALPPIAEEAEFKPALDFLPQHFNKLDTNPAPSVSPETSAQALYQVASIGWWPAPKQTTSPVGGEQWSKTSSSPQFQAPAPIIEQQDTATLTDTDDLKEIMSHTFDATHRGLQEHAHSLKVEVTELSCTALVLLLNIETGHGIVGQIGDGAVLGLSAQNGLKELVRAEDTGDPQSTYTLSRPNFSKHLSISFIDPPADDPLMAIYIMTDGLSGDLLFAPNSAENWAKSINANLQPLQLRW